MNTMYAEYNIKIERLKRKIEKRDKKIKALQGRISSLESKIACLQLSFPRELERTVERVLCNVRMIPVLGIGKENKILDIRVSDD